MSSVDLLPFFTGIYGAPVPGETRYMCIAHLQPGGKMIERYFKWADEFDLATTHINRLIANQTDHGRGSDIYYCVSLLTAKKRNRDFLDETHCIWSDLDDTPPNSLHLPPSFLVQTSNGHYQGIWTLDFPVPYSTAEDFARRIYHAHRKDGADACWDATRLLRVPGAPNLKYTMKSENYYGHPVVEVVDTQGGYSLDEIDAAYPISISTGPGAAQSLVLDYEMVERVGTCDEILQRHAKDLPPDVADMYYDLPDPGVDWSARLWALELTLFECGLDIYEVYKLATEAACNKYKRDGRPAADLWKEVVRGRETVERKAGMVLTTTEIEEIDLLTPDEIEEVNKQPPGFIERYQEWAVSRTDAPREFHIGGALMALSTTLSDRIVVQTQFGPVKPNLWIMLLADSTISRKTTSMRLSIEISEGAGVDALLATDGSMEGIITELGSREGIPSVFVRDEFTSFLDGAKKKDYMSGFLSDLCGLYDGTRVKRRLRKEVIETKKPVFLLFAGGVETKLMELLGHEDITSGFIPRFLPIFGRTSVADLDLIGPRKQRAYKLKDDLIDELKAINALYDPPRPVLRVPNGDPAVGLPVPIEVDLSEEAWKRLKVANRYLLDTAENHDSRDLLLPCTERLITNILKVASLIAASRQRPVVDGVMIMQYEDLMLSLYYARGWLDHMLRIVTKIGRDPFDARTHQVLEFITKQGEGGCTRSVVMRQYRMSKRDADDIFATLEEREEIVCVNTGKTAFGAIYRAGQFARTAKQIRVTAPMQLRRSSATRS